jgi:hypothetical protein
MSALTSKAEIRRCHCKVRSVRFRTCRWQEARQHHGSIKKPQTTSAIVRVSEQPEIDQNRIAASLYIETISARITAVMFDWSHDCAEIMQRFR